MRDSEKLPRSHILRKRCDFEEVRAKGKRVSGKFLALNWLVRGPRRVAVIVPKAVGKAVERNRARRRVREAYRRLQNDLPEQTWSIWIARRGAAEASYEKLSDEMLKLYKRAKIL